MAKMLHHGHGPSKFRHELRRESLSIACLSLVVQLLERGASESVKQVDIEGSACGGPEDASQDSDLKPLHQVKITARQAQDHSSGVQAQQTLPPSTHPPGSAGKFVFLIGTCMQK